MTSNFVAFEVLVRDVAPERNDAASTKSGETIFLETQVYDVIQSAFIWTATAELMIISRDQVSNATVTIR